MDTRIAPERLEAFTATSFTALGVLEEHAAIAAKRIIEADLRGRHGHGILRVPPYARRLRAGGYNLRPDIRLVRDSPVAACVEGDNGLGHVIMTKAVETAVDKAQRSGLAWVGVRGSNHAGAGGVYTAMALQHDLIGCYLAVASANHSAPWGGVDPLLGTNPIAVAIPAGEEPAVQLDIATTVASAGSVKLAAMKGEQLPEGWMIDHSGAPVTDPKHADEGLLLPMAGHKGSGLTLVFGLLAGVLNGAAFGSDVVDFGKDYVSPTNTGHAILVLRPDLFRDLHEFKAEMDRHIRELRSSTSISPSDPVRLPGERAAQYEQEVRASGVPLSAELLAQLRELAAELELDDRLDDTV